MKYIFHHDISGFALNCKMSGKKCSSTRHKLIATLAQSSGPTFCPSMLVDTVVPPVPSDSAELPH